MNCCPKLRPLRANLILYSETRSPNSNINKVFPFDEVVLKVYGPDPQGNKDMR